MILSLRKIALIQKEDPNNSNNDTVVVLTNISEGVDGAAVFGLTNEHSGLSIENGQDYINSASPNLDIRILKPTSDANSTYTGQNDLQQIKDWVDNQTSLHICAISIDGFIYFGDRDTDVGTVKISANEQLSDSDVFAIRVTSKTESGFSPTTSLHQNGFWAGVNGHGIYEWADKDGDNKADGWNLFGISNNSFTSGVQSFDVDDVGVGTFTKKKYMPFEGESVTWSIDFESSTNISNLDTNVLVIRFLDESGTSVSASVQDISSTGRSGLTGVIPASTVYIQTDYSVNTVSGTETVSISNPCLRIDGSSEYTKF